MTPENPDKNIPEWARKERESDLAWITENRTSFWPAAQEQFSAHGRGVIVVDTTVQPDPNAGHPIYYIENTHVEQTDDEDTKRLIRDYDPQQGFVVMLLKVTSGADPDAGEVVFIAH